jgi:hypothetical protein
MDGGSIGILSIDLDDGLAGKERATDNRLLLHNNKKTEKGVRAARFFCDFEILK